MLTHSSQFSFAAGDGRWRHHRCIPAADRWTLLSSSHLCDVTLKHQPPASSLVYAPPRLLLLILLLLFPEFKVILFVCVRVHVCVYTPGQNLKNGLEIARICTGGSEEGFASFEKQPFNRTSSSSADSKPSLHCIVVPRRAASPSSVNWAQWLLDWASVVTLIDVNNRPVSSMETRRIFGWIFCRPTVLTEPIILCKF